MRRPVMRRPVLPRRAATLLVALFACETPRQAGQQPAALRDATRAGTVEARAISEMSGLAASARHPGLFWTHNDSNNDETLFALDSAGRALGEWKVADAGNNDWEAIAVGPCGAGGAPSCVYIGDVGDNSARRRAVSLWRIPEPSRDDAVTARAERVRLAYTDGPRDVEAMWVAPDSSVWLVSKRPHRGAANTFRPALVYRLPSSAWSTRTTAESPATAVLVDSLPIVPNRESNGSWIVDAALRGSRLAVRTYQDVYVFAADSASGRPGKLIARCSTAITRQRVGEAVAWLGNEQLLLGAEGRNSRLWKGRCP